MVVTAKWGGFSLTNCVSTRNRWPAISSTFLSSPGIWSQAGKTTGLAPAKLAISSTQESTSRRVSDDDKHGLRRVQTESCDHKAARRTPNAIDRGSAPVEQRSR